MPYRIDFKKEKGIYKLWNLHKKLYVSTNYKSRKTAISAGKNFIAFREKKDSRVVGNRILPKE